MQKHYNNSLLNLIERLKHLSQHPFEEKACLALQENLIKKISYIERRIRLCKRQIKDGKRLLGAKQGIYLGKEAAQNIKGYIEERQIAVLEYQRILFILRHIGDGIAFTYINKYEIKPMSYKENPGFISGKVGARAERKFFRSIFKSGNIAILNDLTHSLRFGDVTQLSDEGFTLHEVKSSDNSNSRVKRQATSLNELVTYLGTDRIQVEYLGETIEKRRSSLHKDETNHISQLNRLARHSRNNGDAWEQIEPGLFFYCSRTDPEDGSYFRLIRKQCSTPPIVAFLNIDKYKSVGYYPLVLSLEDPVDVLDFFNGELLIFIVVDPSVITQQFAERNLRVEFSNEDDWETRITHLSDPTETNSSLSVSSHFWGRIYWEFLGLHYMVSEISHFFYSKVWSEKN